jgi:hypothetical protein
MADRGGTSASGGYCMRPRRGDASTFAGAIRVLRDLEWLLDRHLEPAGEEPAEWEPLPSVEAAVRVLGFELRGLA